MLTKAAKIFGFVLVAIGIMGFIPALTPDGHLLGIFHVDTPHNLIHLASGLAALITGYTSARASRLYFQIFGVVYGLVAVLGLFAGDNDILGVVANNMSDVALHVAIAGTALYLGFAADRGRSAEA
jgi:hypothetical protein